MYSDADYRYRYCIIIVITLRYLIQGRREGGGMSSSEIATLKFFL